MTEEHQVPDGWKEAVERGEADLSAARTVSGEEVEQRCRDAIARIKARKSQAMVRQTRRAG